MIRKKSLDFLKSKPEDESFHRSRIMFCIKDGKVEVAPKGIMDSHVEWFEKEGWITEKSAKDFLKSNVRGFYLASQNRLYCYRSVGFYFDNKVLLEITNKIAELKEAFNLNDNTEVHLGPKDSPVGGKEYPRVYAGTVEKLASFTLKPVLKLHPNKKQK